MKVSVIDINPGQIHIDPELIAKAVGIETKMSEGYFEQIIQNETREITGYKGFKAGYGITDNVETHLDTGCFYIEGMRFHAGSQIISRLNNSKWMAIFACTAGNEISQRSHKWMSSGHLLEGYIADLIGSVIVEKIANVIRESVTSEPVAAGLHLTNSFSPGYCEWSVDEQHKLFQLLPSGFCGIRLTGHALMKPVKSLSGVIGLGEEMSYQKYVCDLCNIVDCNYRMFKYRV